MSTDEERAWLLRKIAAGGYNIYEDQDGSTANTLYEMAEELAPVLKTGTPVPKTGTVRRWWLRLRFRAKARWLGVIR
jgi:hypothetical protein